jgi:hypothetical protein
MVRRLASILLLALLVAFPALAQVDDVVIVAGQKVFHAQVCSQTAAFNASYLRMVKRDTLGPEFTACPICRPDNPAAASISTAQHEHELEELWSRYDATEVVAIIVGPRTTGLYHRHGCHWLRGAQSQTFARKDADTRYFQPHQECMRRAPDTFTEEVEDALRTGKPVSAKSLLSPPAAVTTSAPVGQSGTSPSSPVLVDTERKQCAATTKKGTRCSRMASAGSAYCWQHAR